MHRPMAAQARALRVSVPTNVRARTTLPTCRDGAFRVDCVDFARLPKVPMSLLFTDATPADHFPVSDRPEQRMPSVCRDPVVAAGVTGPATERLHRVMAADAIVSCTADPASHRRDR
jgi:hypothetical protein